jgi:excinuclease UvrABC nuclease subunit
MAVQKSIAHFVSIVKERRPYLMFRDRRFLPDIPALYVVISDQDELLYIGITIDLQRRWRNHHRAPQMKDSYRIYWRLTESAKERSKYEQVFVQAYRPPWNWSEVSKQEERQDVPVRVGG